jgi:hypothetical protein
MINDPTKILFSTRYNFQKIYMEGTINVNVAATVTPTEYTLATHSLGYIPTARVFYIPVAGQLWPISPNQYDNADGGTGTPLSIFGNPVLTVTTLKVILSNLGGATTLTFYYRIYLDE